MSGISFLEKLLDGVEVEWKALGSLGNLVRGNGLQKKDFTETGVPAIHYGQIYTYYGLSTKETKSFVSLDLAKQLKKVDCGNVIITNTSENLEDVGKALVYLGERQAVTGGHATILKPGEYLLGKYFAYFTQTDEFASEKRKYAKGTKVIDVSATDMAKIKLPIPCPENPKKSLEIQAEIVRILDAFTSLTAELTAELNARKQQYNYYRDQVLSFKEGEVKWKTLGEVADIKIGEFVRKDKQNPSATYPVFNGGRTPTGYYEEYNSDGNKIIVSARGASAGFINKTSTPYWAGNSCYSISIRNIDTLNWMFVYFYLKKSEIKLIGIQQKGGIPAVSKKQMDDFLLPVPSMTEQARIVAILDKFDTLTNSITEGLPREIELRQKQYEYYRDRLFDFLESNVPTPVTD